MIPTTPTITRAELARFITDPKTLRAFEQIVAAIANAPEAVNQAQVDADNAQSDANDANSGVAALKLPSYVTLAVSGTLTNERVLAGSTGVTITAGAPGGNVVVAVNVLTILGFTPANKAGETFTGNVAAPNLSTAGEVRGGTLRVDQAPTATATLSDHSIPINCNGTTYYMRLSATP